MAKQRLEIGTTLDGKALTLPASEAETQTVAVFGGRGMGKTNLGSVFCEELAAAGRRFCYLDPMGVAWGLRHSADGKGEGIKIIILGGRHGDLPIEPTGGAVIAEFVATTRENVLIDISGAHDGRRWSLGAKLRFAADFFERLLEIQGEHRRPLHLLVDEAARFAPQTIEFKRSQDDPIARCKVALEVLMEEGRNAGIGVTLLTQRSARIAKSVTELAELMIAFRIIGPNSTQAVLEWFGAHVKKERHNELLEQLRKLPRGQALVVSPGWLDFEGVARIRLRHTFDSSKTPTGTETKLAQRARPADLEALRAQIAATVEKAESDDPAKLRAQLRAVQAQHQKLQVHAAHLELGIAAKAAKNQAAPKAVAPATIRAKDREQLERIAKAIETATKNLQTAAPRILEQLRGIFDKASTEIGKAVAAPDFVALMKAIQAGPAPASTTLAPGAAWRNPATGAEIVGRRPPAHAAADKPAPRPPAPPPARELGELGEDHRLFARGDLKKPVRAILTALAQHPEGRTREQTLILAGYVPSGDTAVAIAGLLEHGLVEQRGKVLAITARGVEVLGPYDPLPQGPDLRAHLLNGSKLSSAEKKIIGAVFEAWPNPIATRGEICEAAGLKPSGDTAKAIAKFQKLGWVEKTDGGFVAAAETFFPEGV